MTEIQREVVAKYRHVDGTEFYAPLGTEDYFAAEQVGQAIWAGERL